MNKQISNCCQKRMKAFHGYEGTGYYMCSECRRVCDPYVSSKDALLHEKDKPDVVTMQERFQGRFGTNLWRETYVGHVSINNEVLTFIEKEIILARKELLDELIAIWKPRD